MRPQSTILNAYRGALPNMLPTPLALQPSNSATGFQNPANSAPPSSGFVPRLVGPLHASISPLATRAVSPTLEEALDAVDVEKIKQDLFWVADDARGGRGTPSQGQSETADYIEKRVREFGWISGTQDGTYRHNYELWGGWLDTQNTRITLTSGDQNESFVPEKDYFYTSVHKTSEPQILNGEIIFVGLPLADVTDRHDLKDKWVVVYDSNIDPALQRTFFQKAGAKGIILIPGPDSTGFQYERKLHAMMKHYDVTHSSSEGTDGDFQKTIDEVMFNAEAASRLLALLTTPEFLLKPKKSGFPGVTLLHNSAALSSTVSIQDNRVPLANPFKKEAQNVAAFWPGSDPELSKEVIVLTAHYDHLGTRGGTVYNGSDDNGSGTVGLMALAEAVAKLNPKRSVMLLWVSGEEKGLLGSAAWVKDYQKNPWLPNGSKLVANINMDMISRNDPKQFSLTPSASHRRYNVISKTAAELAGLEGFTKVNSGDRYYNRSDQYNFAEILGIPVAFLTVDEHEDYHRPSDDPDKGDYDKIRRITRMFVRVIDALDSVDVIK